MTRGCEMQRTTPTRVFSPPENAFVNQAVNFGAGPGVPRSSGLMPSPSPQRRGREASASASLVQFLVLGMSWLTPHRYLGEPPPIEHFPCAALGTGQNLGDWTRKEVGAGQ